MRRFLLGLMCSSPAARRARRTAPNARPGLEALERREVPAVLGINGINYTPRWNPADLTQVVFAPPPAITLPSAQLLNQKAINLALQGSASTVFGSMHVDSLMLQADGSYAITCTYSTWSYTVIDNMMHPVSVTLTGTAGAAQYAGAGVWTCSLTLEGVSSGQANILGVPQMVNEHVHFSGTVTLTGAHPTVTGQLYDCLENPVTHDRIDPYCHSVQVTGSFI
jgi:hypothetical protein